MAILTKRRREYKGTISLEAPGKCGHRVPLQDFCLACHEEAELLKNDSTTYERLVSCPNVAIYPNDEAGEFQYSVTMEDNYWLGSFPSEKRARDFIKRHGLKERSMEEFATRNRQEFHGVAKAREKKIQILPGVDAIKDRMWLDLKARLAERRSTLKMTMAQLAKKAGVPTVVMTAWWNSETSLCFHSLAVICRALGVTISFDLRVLG